MVKLSSEQIANASEEQREAILDSEAKERDGVLSNQQKQRMLEKIGFSHFDASGEAQAFRGITLTEIKRVFDQHQDKANWKNRFVAFVPFIEVSVLVAGIELYHGATARIIGDNCDVTGLVIESPGYQAN
jgi:hypothetical protein